MLSHRQYIQTYLERDLRQLIHLKDFTAFQKFLTLCASNCGQLINYQKMSGAVGISVNTAKHWLSILEASYVIARLQPYFKNIKKRLVRSPKLYFVDVGLAAYLLGMTSAQHMATHPLRGALFENLVVMELIKPRYNLGLDPRLSFYRDTAGNEVDVLFEQNNQVIPIAIKSSQTFHTEFMHQIEKLRTQLPCAEPGAVIYTGQHEQNINGHQLLNYQHCWAVLA